MSGLKESRTTGSSADGPVPVAAVGRLSLYLRQLDDLLRQGCQRVSSRELGRALSITDAQVRKDLAYFGQFGYPGIGYRVAELVAALRRILGTDHQWNMALVGVGNLGRALVRYRGFSRNGFHLVALFDCDQAKVGQDVDGLVVHSMDELAGIVRAEQIRMAIIAVPAEAAQEVADALGSAGVRGILNFAPTPIVVPESVRLNSVDLTVQLEHLSYKIQNERGSIASIPLREPAF